jgi:predicted hydrolase (HD superfamily)
LDRFSVFLLIRRHLQRRSSRNQALATEAIMEDLAAHLGEQAEHWGVMGLLSQLDLEYAQHNPEIRGASAAQQAEMEGLKPDEASHLRRWCLLDHGQQSEALAFAAVEQALFLASFLAEQALVHNERGFDDEAVTHSLGHDLELARQNGDPRGDRLDQALSQLGIDTMQASRITFDALQRVAQDLR